MLRRRFSVRAGSTSAITICLRSGWTSTYPCLVLVGNDSHYRRSELGTISHGPHINDIQVPGSSRKRSLPNDVPMSRVDRVNLTLACREDDELLEAKLIPEQVALGERRGREGLGVATARESADETRSVAGQILRSLIFSLGYEVMVRQTAYVQLLDMPGQPGEESLLIEDSTSLLDLSLRQLDDDLRLDIAQ